MLPITNKHPPTNTHLQLCNFVPCAWIQQPYVVVRRSDPHHCARLIRSKRIYAAYRRLHGRCCCGCCSRRCCSCCPVPVLLLCCPSCAACCTAAFAGVGHEQVRLEGLHIVHDDLPMQSSRKQLASGLTGSQASHIVGVVGHRLQTATCNGRAITCE